MDDVCEGVKREKSLSEKERWQCIAYFLRKYTGETVESIGTYHLQQVTVSAVSKIISRVEKRKGKDRAFRKRLKARISLAGGNKNLWSTRTPEAFR